MNENLSPVAGLFLQEDVVMNENLWPLVVEVMRALRPHYGPAMEETAAAAGLERPAWFLLLPTLIFEPEPVSADRLRVRMPYNAGQYYHEGLATLANRGMLAAGSENEYRLTGKGRETVQHIIEAAYTRMAGLEPMPLADLERLAALLRRLVEASVAAPEPPGKWSICLSRRTDLGEDAAVVIRIDQYLSDLAAYRDDAHLAAWRPYGISGPAWEALTLLWRGEAGTLDGLYQKLEWRRYTRAVYAEALEDLVGRGWIVTEAGHYWTTVRGRTIRQEAEEVTDHYFYAPWSCLNEGESLALEGLLTQLRDGLRRLSDRL
ncbi:MAG TPA: hypothetical protein VF177_08510 [Anaerolineae bacterium]